MALKTNQLQRSSQLRSQLHESGAIEALSPARRGLDGCSAVTAVAPPWGVLLRGRSRRRGLRPGAVRPSCVALRSARRALLPGALRAASEMSFLPDFGIFTMGMWSVGLGAVGAAITGIVLANTDLFLSKPEKATLEFLEAIELKTLGSEPRTFKASELWKKNGAVIMAVRRPG